MAFEYVQQIPSVDEIIKELPLPEKAKQVKAERDKILHSIFRNEDSKNRFLLIIGPCSADNEDAVCEYLSRLKKVQDQVKDKLFLVPRIYTNKPRTTGEGYKGMAHQPDPRDRPNIVRGLKAIRKMHIRALVESGLSAADEMLYPANYQFLEDLLSYVAVGARSVENQQHRLTVSGFDVPVGMKNPTSGDLTVLLNSIQATQISHEFIYCGWEVKTPGNDMTHAILRGAFNQYGRNVPNYHYEDMVHLVNMYLKRNLKNPAVLVDCNHANSGKKFSEQPRIAMEVLQSRKRSDLLRDSIKGLLIESYLEEGSQSISEGQYGKSITDPCLGWSASETLIHQIADQI